MDETDLARIAVFCHFARDLLLTKKELTLLHALQAGTIARCQYLSGVVIIQDYAGHYCPTTGNQDPIEETKALSRNKLQENGISSPCRSRSYVDHELLTNCLHVAHNGGCAVLFKKDTFLLYIKVKSIYLHDTRRESPDEVMEGDSGRVLQGVLSRVSFRRRPLNGQKHVHSCVVAHQVHYAKERGIGKKLILTIRAVMLDEKVDLVAGDFSSPAWRSSNRNNISTIEEAFADCALPMPPGPTPLWGLGAVPRKWADVGGFLNHLDSDG